MIAEPTVPAQIKRHIAAEAGPRECEVVSLLRGCYGSLEYMEANYGFTSEYIQHVLNGISEAVEWISDEYDIDLQEGDIIDIMVEYADRHSEAWDDLIS